MKVEIEIDDLLCLVSDAWEQDLYDTSRYEDSSHVVRAMHVLVNAGYGKKRLHAYMANGQVEKTLRDFENHLDEEAREQAEEEKEYGA